MKVIWIIFIVLTVLEIFGTFAAANMMFNEQKLPELICLGGLKANGKVEIQAPPPSQKVTRYDNIEVCEAEQSYNLALALTIGFCLTILKVWLCVPLYYYQRQLRDEQLKQDDKSRA